MKTDEEYNILLEKLKETELHLNAMIKIANKLEEDKEYNAEIAEYWQKKYEHLKPFKSKRKKQ